MTRYTNYPNVAFRHELSLVIDPLFLDRLSRVKCSSEVVKKISLEEQVTDININRLQEVVDKEREYLGFLTKYQYFMGVNKGNPSDQNSL